MSNDPSLATMRWTTPSAFLNATPPPWVLVAGFGENDCAPLVATMAIVSAAAPPPGGLGLVGVPPSPPQADVTIASNESDRARFPVVMPCPPGPTCGKFRTSGAVAHDGRFADREEGPVTGSVTAYDPRPWDSPTWRQPCPAPQSTLRWPV